MPEQPLVGGLASSVHRSSSHASVSISACLLESIQAASGEISPFFFSFSQPDVGTLSSISFSLSSSATQSISSTVEVKGTLPTRTFRGEPVSEEKPNDWE